MYWGDRFATSQLEIWEPYLRASRHRFLVLCDPGPIPQRVIDRVLASSTNIAFAHSGWDLEQVRSASSVKGFLYVGNRRRNFLVVARHPRKMHVFIGHGDSGKASSYSRAATLYDAVFVARYSALKGFRPDVAARIRWRSLAIGAAVPGGLEDGSGTSGSAAPALPLVLYCPTWEGYRPLHRYTSLEVVAAELERLGPERPFRLTVRPHPGTGKKLPHLENILDTLHAAGAEPSSNKIADMNAADVLLGDVSGATSEFLFTGKPTILAYGPHLAGPGLTREKLQELYPYAYVWDVGTQSLSDAVRAALADPAGRRRRRRARSEVYRGHRDVAEATATFDLALECVQRPGRSPRLAFELRRRVPAALVPALSSGSRRLSRVRRGLKG